MVADTHISMNPGESASAQARQQREKAERLMRSAEAWEKGAEGERAVGAALAALGSDWVVLHDVRWPGRRFANIDHIAIGPGGVFVIDAKNWSGAISVANDVLRQNGYRRDGAVAGCADSAIAVGELISGHTTNVIPVLCFVGEVTIEGAAREVALCTTANLVERLVGNPTVLSPDEVREIGVRLRLGTATTTVREPPAHATRPTVRGMHPARRRQTRAPARVSRRRKKARGEAISAAITLVVGLVILRSVTSAHRLPAAQVAPPHKHTGTVVYRLTATDPHGARAVSWNEGTGGTIHTVSSPALPFERTYPLAHVASPTYTINANYGGSGTVTCQITVDGAVISTKSAKGPYGLVNCAAYGNG